MMDRRTFWTWVMRGYGGIVRMIIMASNEDENIPAGVAVELKEYTDQLQLVIQKRREDR